MSGPTIFSRRKFLQQTGALSALTLAGKRGEAESLLRPDMSGEQVRMAIAGIQALQAPQR